MCCWFKKGAEFCVKNPKSKIALVSTSSIIEGQHISILWNELLNDIKIDFAYKSFQWNNEAKNKKTVHCTIIGFLNKSLKTTKKIFTIDKLGKIEKEIQAERISPYLNNESNAIIELLRKPIGFKTKLKLENMALDDGNLILENKEKEDLLTKYPEIESWIRPYVGAREFIYREKRCTLWLVGIHLSEVMKYSEISKRIELVKEFREKSVYSETKDSVKTPAIFTRITQKESDKNFIIIPKVTSSEREYIPIGFMKNVIISSANLFAVDGSIIDFAFLTSNAHMFWMKKTARRLGAGYRYSAFMVYNTFSLPKLSSEIKTRLEKSAKKF